MVDYHFVIMSPLCIRSLPLFKNYFFCLLVFSFACTFDGWVLIFIYSVFLIWVNLYTRCRNPSLGLMTKARAYKGAGQEGSPRIWEECENGHSHSQVSSHVGNWSLGGLPNLHRVIARVKTHRIKEFFISLKSY
jgi:hypothetical protein